MRDPLLDLDLDAVLRVLDALLLVLDERARVILRRVGPTPTTARARARARHARAALKQVEDVRQYTLPGHLDARRAALAGLLAGLLTDDAPVLIPEAHRRARLGGRERGRDVAEAARERQKRILRGLKRWEASEYLQAEYRSPVSYLEATLHLDRTTIYRALRKKK